MIDPVLPPACYTESTWFELEQEKIFKKLWLFAGLTQQLQSENSFITRDFSGVSVLIQNLGGELRAFRNACAHRGMPIQTTGCGNRKLICPYHGWSYDDLGALRGIPNAKMYGICDEQKKHLKLHSYPVEKIGAFVFINLSDSPEPISTQFTKDLMRLLVGVSQYFAPDVSSARFTCQYNWKLNFENILDWNHLQFVHQRTLAPLIQIEPSGALSVAESNESRLFASGSDLDGFPFSEAVHSSGPIDTRNLSDISRVSMPYHPRWFSPMLDEPCDIGAFFNCKIFPNLNFGSIHGEWFYLQQYVPMAPDRIDYHSWIFTSRLKRGVAPQPHLLWGLHHAEKRVIDEDAVLLAKLQEALRSASTVGIMGDHEATLNAMGRWYMQQMNTTES